jgi:hypothetical protein
VFENTPSQIAGSVDAWAEVVIQGIPINEPTVTNMAVFIWSDDTVTTVGDILYIADVQLEVGSVSNALIPVNQTDELQRCQRYYEKSYRPETAPGAVSSNGCTHHWTPVAIGSGVEIRTETFRTPKRLSAPTITMFSVTTGASGVIRNFSDGADRAAIGVLMSDGGFTVQSSGAGAADADEQLRWQWAADAEI